MNVKRLIPVAIFLMIATFSYANGLLTNTNQSAQFIRMMSRNASLGIDAAYYNPAGLIKLEDGWHFSLNNQTLFQKRIITSQFPLLNDGSYEGKVTIPSFPTGFAVYKKNRWAVSFGFGPNAGGGTSQFDRGLPSFEIPIAKLSGALSSLTPQLAPLGMPVVSGYDANLTFEGSSVFWGIQLGLTYEISEMLSLSAGVRYMPAKNIYIGSIQDVTLKTGSGQIPAEEYLGTLDNTLTSTIGFLTMASSTLQGAINAGLVDPAAVVSDPQLVQVMTLLGMPSATNQQALGVMTTANAGLAQLQNEMQGVSVADRELDVEQKGAGITPVLGLQLAFNEFVNLGLRYEHKTYMTVENNTTIDELGLFPDGAISRSDVPGIFGAGLGVTDNYWFEAQLSFNMYFDKNVSWGGNVRDISVWKDLDPSQIRMREIEHNSFDVALGLQFNATDVFAVSAGVMYQKAGVADSYNSDFNYAPPSYVSIGAGIMWKITEDLDLDLGVTNIFYQDAEVRYLDPMLNVQYNESYGKKSLGFAVGLSYTIPY